MKIEGASDNELIEAARRDSSPAADRYLEELYRRYYSKVASWCLRICGDRDEATDLAQDVFLRVHSRLDSFRMDSRFSTWLYTVVRSVSINRGIRSRRRRQTHLAEEAGGDPTDPAPGPDERAAERAEAERLRKVMREVLEPLEATVIYMHHYHGMTLPEITRLLELRNRSGAKAYVVSAMRKLKRGFRDDIVAAEGSETGE